MKTVYFFRGDLRTHVGLYKSWVDLVKNDIDITMLTFMSPTRYREQYELVTKYKADGIKIYSIFEKFNRLAVLMYFTFLCIKHQSVVVHLRKQPIRIFKLLRKITFGRLKFVVDIEGDFESELIYLLDPKNKYKSGFYDNDIASLKENSHVLENELRSADGILVTTEEMKKLFINRYLINDINKFTVLPTVFDKNKFKFNTSIRESYRKRLDIEDKTVLIFAGSVYYSWQNIKRSIEVFQLLIKEKIITNGHFVILTREVDFPIVKGFADNSSLKTCEYTLKNVSHDEVNGYLNACDIGILLRDDHQLNHIVSTGKMGEYLAAGLPVITSSYIGLYSQAIKEKSVGIVLTDINSDLELLNKANDILLSDDERYELSLWASKRFSLDNYKVRYLNALKRLN
jgi:glycosyltransferase involved in cell wall biosynthesis